MRILVLGGSGMLGHKAYQTLLKEFDTYITFRNFNQRLKNTGIFNEKKVFDQVDADNFTAIEGIIKKIKPQIVLNCVGVIKQANDAKDPKLMIYVNSLLPHLLAECCENAGAKLIHISTDCVFSGKKGSYTEQDPSDAEDLYGKTKFLGEIGYGSSLTLRTSIVGRELFSNLSLIDWFLSQEGKTINGYTKAIYTGLTSLALCQEIIRIIKFFPDLSGLYHVSSEMISKYDLLMIVKKVYGLHLDIVPDHHFLCNRSLNSQKYRGAVNFVPLSWEEMILAMFNNEAEYTYRRL